MKNTKEEIKNVLIDNAVQDIERIRVKKNESEYDKILDTLIEDLMIIETYRYTIRLTIPKSREWCSDILPHLDENRFIQMIRVNLGVFNFILSKIQNDPVFHGCNSCHQFPIQVQLAVVLFRLGSSGESASIRKIAAIFGIGDGGTIEKITSRVFKAIQRLRSQYIYWPNGEERKMIVASTYNELPYCIGYMDGTEIKLSEAPVVDKESYFSRKKIYSIKAQVICDAKLIIRQVTVGHPGSVHDARIFTACNLSNDPLRYLSPPEWIAADSAYKLTENVITPYKKNSRQVSANVQKTFNYTFSKYRVRVEHCIGLLKERFSSLKELRLRIHTKESNKLACDWFIVCCIIHNLVITEKEDCYMDIADYVMENYEVCELEGRENHECAFQLNENVRAEMKRKAISTLMLAQ
ncbi:protein ALP1-like [Photinus pyralis]|uniref:protein ALP1-like n=1 Tax=Photinus pyralis TaxID=7054 RepID=UPI00126720A5|nr:protein ALP1-like [Photinus pyralis]